MKTSIYSELLLKSGAVNAVSLRVEGKPNFFSMRRNGSMNNVEAGNRVDFLGLIGFDENSIARAEQVHGDKIAFVETAGNYSQTDALVTRKENLLLTISVADCVSILIYDRKLKAAAAVHAGWRGTAKEISAKTLEFLFEEIHSKREDIVAFIGPSAGICCYEVGEEVAHNFPDEYVEPGSTRGKFMLDLKSANAAQLVGKGVPKENIEVSEHCSICDTNFHSFRRDGESSGRMLAAIAIK